ncbi:MAG: SMR family transporter [Eubacteriales bacterium]|nr:SMR family transporter [Eubacteriales bacterium]
MGYLLLGVLCSTLIAVIMRLSTEHVRANFGMLAMNYAICSALAALHIGSDGLFPAAEGLGRAAGLGVLGGALFLASLLLLQYNTAKNGVVLTNVFMKLGLLVPIALSTLFFGESMRQVQGVGFLLAVAAILLSSSSGGAIKKLRVNWQLLLLLLASGAADVMAKVYAHFGAPSLSDQFLFYNFGAAMLFGAALMLAKGQRPGRAEVFFGLLVGVPNFYSSRFLLKALESVPAVIAYPTYSVSTLLLVSLAGVMLFKEKLQKNQWQAVALILCALVLLNI